MNVQTRILAALALLLGILLWPTDGFAQRVQLSVERGEIYAGLPFVLSVVANGFEENPEPAVEAFAIKGAKVDFLGVSPNVSTSISIINGRRSESKQVSFVYRYRVVAPSAGAYTVPAVTVTQGSTTAKSQPARFQATAIATTRDMRLQIGLPSRPIWIGETFDLTIDWLLRSDPNDPSFYIPAFELEDQFRVVAPDAKGNRSLAFQVGDRELELPYERDQQTIAGVEYSRFRFVAKVTPQRAGTIALPPASVVAKLRVGYGRDAFGFRTRRSKIFKAEDQPRTLEVRPVPMQGRPPSFAGAVGSRFSIEAQASRTVVRVGDPIELKLLVRGDGPLEGLKLPNMSGDHALAEEHFEIPGELPPGETTDDGSAKLFRVSVRLRSTDAREIPAIPFSYFDPKTGQYSTIRTQPIALSIAGSNVVGAGDVVSAARAPAKTAADVAAETVIDADLSLSRPSETLRTVLHVDSLAPLLGALYLAPLLLLFGRFWHLRTRERRGQSSQERSAHRKTIAAIDRAKTQPARDAAPAVLSALRDLAKATGNTAKGPVIARLETEGYRPDADKTALDAELLADARRLADALKKPAPPTTRSAAGTAALLVLAFAVSATAGEGVLANARAAYSDALAIKDRGERAQKFAAVAQTFQALNERYDERPELLTDWGQAALGARDFGAATLAYRRALALDPGLERAASNLHWLRENAPITARAATTTGAADVLFFWHTRLSAAQKHLIAALAFALCLLLATPLARRPRRRAQLRLAAMAPALVTIAMLGSVIMTGSVEKDLVVVDGTALLRAADSAGAPAVQSTPLGGGTEGTAIDERGNWVRIRLGDGSAGWIRRDAVAFVVPRTDSEG